MKYFAQILNENFAQTFQRFPEYWFSKMKWEIRPPPVRPYFGIKVPQLFTQSWPKTSDSEVFDTAQKVAKYLAPKVAT